MPGRIYTRRETCLLLRIGAVRLGELVDAETIACRLEGRRQMFLGEELLRYARGE